MYYGILIALVPLSLGYLIKLKDKKWLAKINQILSWMVYFILFIMGTELAHLDNLSANLQTILFYTVVIFICTFGGNFIFLIFFYLFLAWKNTHNNKTF